MINHINLGISNGVYLAIRMYPVVIVRRSVLDLHFITSVFLAVFWSSITVFFLEGGHWQPPYYAGRKDVRMQR